MLLDRFRLDEKVALLSGAGRGIGRAIAEGFAELGAEMILVAHTQSEMQSAVNAAGRFGRRAIPVEADMADPAAQESVVKMAIDRFIKIDILVNAAAVGWPGENPSESPGGKYFLSTTPEEWAKVTTTNLDAAAGLMHVVAQQMIHLGGGKIINVMSAPGHHSTEGFPAYGASKDALEQLTQTLAHDLGQRWFHVNCIAMGRIVTETLASGEFWPAERCGAVGRQITIGRVDDEDDVAPLAVFLASDASDYENGTTIAFDGDGYVHSPIEAAP